MLREIQQNPNIIYYWLTPKERDSNRNQLSIEYKQWKDAGYQVCTFVSGTKDLTETTTALLAHNNQVGR